MKTITVVAVALLALAGCADHQEPYQTYQSGPMAQTQNAPTPDPIPSTAGSPSCCDPGNPKPDRIQESTTAQAQNAPVTTPDPTPWICCGSANPTPSTAGSPSCCDPGNPNQGSTTPVAPAPPAADEVVLHSERGVYTLPVTINDAITQLFVLDSGASDVTIPIDVFKTLVQSGTVDVSDVIGMQRYVMADGSTGQSPTFLIHELRVGNHPIENVTASVTPAGSEPLLGQGFLSRLPAWTVNNNGSASVLSISNPD
jgi:hypothetical protein